MIRLLCLAAVVMALGTAAAAASHPPAEAFAEPDAFRAVALSADGSKIAVVTQRDSVDVLEVFHADRLAAGPTAVYRLGPAPSVNWIMWKGERLVLGVENPDRSPGFLVLQTRMLSTDEHLKDFLNLTRNLRQNNDPPQFQDQVIADLPSDPNNLEVAIDWLDPLHPGVVKIDVRNATVVRLHGGFSGVSGWLADPDGERRLAFGDPDKNRPTLSAVGPGGGLTTLRGVGAGAFVPLAVDGDPDVIAVASSHEDGVLGLYDYSLSRQAFTRTLFKVARFDVAGAVLSPDGRRVVGARYVDDQPHVAFFDQEAEARAARVAALIGSKQAEILSQTWDGRFVIAGARDGGRLTASFWLDLKTTEVRPFGRFHPSFDAITFGRTFSIAFKARDGTAIPGYVTLPPGIDSLAEARALPFVVMPHGGPEARDDMDFDWWAQFVATRGYGVFQPNFRGSAGYGDAFVEAGRRAWGTTVMNDVVDGTRWLITQGYADPRRLCVAGWSFGGYVALEAAVDNADLFKCAASTAGVSDLPSFIDSEKAFAGGDVAMRRMVGDLWRERVRLDDESPLRHVETIAIPVLLVHGAADARVPVEQSRRMKARLVAAKKSVQYLEFDLADHSLTHEKYRLSFLKALERFLDANIGVQ